ncbi:Serine/threonine-protein kinase PknD [Rubripirellula lacrimiformis]|uniref:Serine/threonine-protein kinase PknD n=1 Tax=Rubripirellula lacrimiformis TaxID=1930273 RepID=A0A517N7N6_9BACT|nr:protein kinase [Rubripirellula lacrimiformis]QDT03157.1 Serine/threonine-protein kinase PknD [Rubripirellula lacrimiformis]
MAKKKKPSSRASSPNDETVRIDAEQESVGDADRSSKPDSESPATGAHGDHPTVDSPTEKTPTGHTTILPTRPPSPPTDLDATVTLDSTLVFDDAADTDASVRDTAVTEPQDGTQETVAVDPTFHPETGGRAPLDKTVANIDIDQTVEITAQESADNQASIRNAGTVVYRGTADRDVKADNADKSGIEATVASLDATVKIGGTILGSQAIGATVNPRELSPEEAKQWSSIVGGDDRASRSYDSPAINRSFSDLHLERLRRNQVAEPHSDPNLPSDYRLNRKLGQGGMGDVYLARQRSLDRLLALKVIKPLEENRRRQLQKSGRLDKVEDERRMQFLAEAIITGDLDHPNIVPVHDVALTADGDLFYSMKRVDGTPWSDQLPQMTMSENLQTLLRVCDAVGFAHTRNVVHRDIKPENIMLGDFGVVMVMDWGLALPTGDYDKEKQASILSTSGLGGTPAFMAPEMAIGPLENIGVTADIYLLGATLFMIVTGNAPHQARNVSECLKVVRNNAIREIEDKHRGELMDIAMKAMATLPADRYQSVAEFQQAIQEFLSHDQSNGQATRAFELLHRGKQNRSLADFHRAVQGFEEAIQSWDGNQRARDGLAETIIAHSETAYETGEFESGIALLDAENPEHAELLAKLIHARDERDSRVGRLKLLRRVTAAMLVFILVGAVVSVGWINQARNEAEKAAVEAKKAEKIAKLETSRATEAGAKEKLAKEEAQKATQEAHAAKDKEREAKDNESIAKNDAIAARLVAEKSTREALEAKQEAEESKERESEARQAAVRGQKAAQYEEYVSKIGLAKARLEANDGQGARKILKEVEHLPRSNGWEWRWLMQQASQSTSDIQVDAPVIDSSISSDGRHGVIATEDGRVVTVTFDENGNLAGHAEIDPLRLASGLATSVAIADDPGLIAVGLESGDIWVLTPSGDRVLNGHQGRIADLQFTVDQTLVSGSADRTVRVWDGNDGEQLTAAKACWHLSPVRQLAVAGDRAALRVAVATSDNSGGQVSYWKFASDDEFRPDLLGTFSQHLSAVSAITLSDDGRWAASGDRDGHVWVWKPSDLKTSDYAQAIASALDQVDDVGGDAAVSPAPSSIRSTVRYAALSDPRFDDDKQWVSTADSKPVGSTGIAHQDVVRSIRFSQDGRSIVTASDDYTSKRWGLEHRDLETVMRGHGGWVVGADFLDAAGNRVVSASNDGSVRTWNADQYRGEFVSQVAVDGAGDGGTPDGNEVLRDAEAHAKEISSARFSLDGTRVLTASRDHTARVLAIDPETLAFKTVVTLDSNEDRFSDGTSYVAMSMATDVNQDRLWIGNADATIRVWDIDRGVEVDRVNGTGLNSSFAVSSDGRWLLTGASSVDVKAILWELDPTGKLPPRNTHSLGGHDQAVTAFAISSDGSQLFTGDRDGFGLLWDAATGRPIGAPIENVRGFRINAAAFSPDGRHLLVAADDEQLTKIDLQTRQQVGRWNHDGFVTRLSLSDDARWAVTVSERSSETRLTTTATCWDLSLGKGVVLDRLTQRLDPTASGRTQRRRITSAGFGAGSNQAAVCRSAWGDNGSMVQLFDLDSVAPDALSRDPEAADSKPLPAISQFQLPERLGTSEVVLPLADQKILTMNQNAAFQWDLSSGDLVKSYRTHVALTEASLSSDAKWAATASRSIKIWDAETGLAVEKIESPHAGPVRSVAFSMKSDADQHWLATGGDDGYAKLWTWNPKSKALKLSATLGGESHRTSIRRVGFSNDGNRLMAVGDHGRLTIWNVGQTQPVWTFGSDTVGNFTCGRFSEDGKTIAIGSTDHKVRVWTLDDADGPLGQPIVMDGHADAVLDVAVVGAGETMRIFTASADDSARVWDPRIGTLDEQQKPVAGREIISLRRHDGDVTTVDATRDGRLLMSAGNDGNVVLWPAQPVRTIQAESLFDVLDED